MSKTGVALVGLFAFLLGVAVALFVVLNMRSADLVDSLREENKLLHKLNETLQQRRDDRGSDRGT